MEQSHGTVRGGAWKTAGCSTGVISQSEPSSSCAAAQRISEKSIAVRIPNKPDIYCGYPVPLSGNHQVVSDTIGFRNYLFGHIGRQPALEHLKLVYMAKEDFFRKCQR